MPNTARCCAPAFPSRRSRTNPAISSSRTRGRAGGGHLRRLGETTDFFASLTDRDGDAAYPISTAVFAVVQVSGRSEHRYRRVHDLFRLAFAQGAGDATALGYVPLPKALVDQVEQYWAKQVPVGN